MNTFSFENMVATQGVGKCFSAVEAILIDSIRSGGHTGFGCTLVLGLCANLQLKAEDTKMV